MKSLNSRVLIAAGFVLAAFLGAAGFALDRAFEDSAITSLRERLSGRVYFVLGILDLDDPIDATVPLDGSMAELANPESGHYAQLLDGAKQVVWHSQSMLGISFTAEFGDEVGQFSFAETESSTGEPLWVLSYTVLWEGAGARSNRYTVQVAEDERTFIAQVNRFRKSLWLGFMSIGVILLLVQTVILRWGLKPLRDVATEVDRIERGEQTEISGSYPLELSALTQNLNKLIHSNDSSLKRYRNALGDLAHSLKTPLAVIRTTLAGNGPDKFRNLESVLDELDDTIDYQLNRAAAAGRSAIGGSFPLAPELEKLASSLRKVHADRSITLVLEVASNIEFNGDRGDLMEMVGNIADNACKWARHDVSITARKEFSENGRFLCISVVDDGPGMPPGGVEKAIQRGTRLDQSTAGHGIGLAVVKEMVEDVYAGTLQIQTADSGTRVKMQFPGY